MFRPKVERDIKLTSYSINWVRVSVLSEPKVPKEAESTAGSDDKIDGTTLSRK